MDSGRRSGYGRHCDDADWREVEPCPSDAGPDEIHSQCESANRVNDGESEISKVEQPSNKVLSATLEIKEVPNIFDDRNTTVHFESEECLLDVLIDQSEVRNGTAKCWVNDNLIAPNMFHLTVCELGDSVVIKAIPQGDDAGKILQLINTLSAVIASAFFPAAAVYIGVAAAFINIGVSLLFPPPRVNMDQGDAGPDSSVKTIQGTRNRLRPYGSTPFVIGLRHRIWPNLAAKPYTEIIGGEQYIRMIFEIHTGFCLTLQSEMFIGQVKLENFQDFEIEIRDTETNQANPSELFSKNVTEVSTNFKLNNNGGIGSYSQHTAVIDATEASFDLSFPKGIGTFNDKNDLIPYTFNFQIQKRLVGSPTWLNVTDAKFSSGMGWRNSGSPFFFYELIGTQRGHSIRGIRIPLIISPGVAFEMRIRIQSDFPDADTFLTDYEQHLNDCFVTRFRSSSAVNPVLTPNVATVALRIRATEQLSGVIDTFNCVVQPFVARYLGAWSDDIYLTGDAAWHYAAVLRGKATSTPVDDSRIDTDSLTNWAALTSGTETRISGYIDRQEMKRYWLEQIAATSRGVPSIINGKYGVIIDQAQATPVQMITDRNSSEIKGAMDFKEQPHALLIRFTDETNNYQTDELTVYWDGFSSDGLEPGTVAATVFKEIDLWGITDPDGIWRLGRYHLAASRLRRRSWTAKMDYENLIANRGDKVILQSSNSLVSVGSFRIAYIDPGNIIGFDMIHNLKPFGVEDYECHIRKSDGLIFDKNVINLGVETNELIIDITGATGAPVAPGDLVTIEIRFFSSFEAIITGVRHQSSLEAIIEFSEYGEDIFSAHLGDIPPWVPKITSPTAPNVELPLPPKILAVVSDESVLTTDASGVAVPRILVSYELAPEGPMPYVIQAQFRLLNASSSAQSPWENITSVNAQMGQISILPIEDGGLYDFQIRTVTFDGKPSQWVLVSSHRAIGRTTPPPTPTLIKVSASDLLYWDVEREPLDLRGYIIKYQSEALADWGTGIPAHAGFLTSRQVDLGELANIPRDIVVTIMVKAIDIIGIESEGFAFVITTLTDLTLNVINTVTHEPTWPGTKTDCTVSVGELEADTDTAGFWSGNDAAPFWTDDANLFWADIYREMDYLALSVTGAAGTLRLNLVSLGSFALTYSYDFSDEAFWPGSIEVEAGKLFVYRAVGAGGKTQARMINYNFQIDVPDQREAILGIVSSGVPGGQIVVPTKAFINIQTVVVTITGQVGPIGTSAHAFVVHNKAPAGPLIELFDIANVTAIIGQTFDVEFIGW